MDIKKFSSAYPVCLCVVYMVSRLVSAFRGQRTELPIIHTSKKRRIASSYIASLHAIFCLCLAATAVITGYVLANGLDSMWWTSSDYLASVLGVGAFFVAGLLPDADEQYTPATWNANTWVVCIVFETTTLSLIMSENHFSLRNFALDLSEIALSVLRIFILVAMFLIFWLPGALGSSNPNTPEETERLIPSTRNDVSRTEYGTRERLKGGNAIRVGDAQNTNWTDYVVGFKKLFPFLWPSDSRPLQLRAVFCFLLLICQRVVNILVPHQMGVVVSELGPGKMPYFQLFVFVVLRGLQGQQGVIGSIRALLWIPISQSTYRRLTYAAFQHVLLLSLDFHLNKRIGEVMSALSKGSALNTFLDGFAFQLFPMVADLWIAAIYFMVEFDFFYALVVVSITWSYLYVTIYMAKYRGRARREMVMRDREMEAAKTDALMSYETVHHNGAVGMEMSRFQKLVSIFQGAEFNVFFSLNILNAVQNGVFTVGVMVLFLLDAFQISRNEQTVSKFITLLGYLTQLQAPLNFFGSFYTQVQNNLVDAERMLDLFNEEPSIVDSKDAKPLENCDGHISVQDVHFAYDARKPALRGISFEVPLGTSTAIVGESGSGKSTILKLLFRFYDIDSGSIKVDGKDIRDITVDNLRSHFGIVPQDTILFNDTLMYNLIYSKPDATEEEVYAACRAARIHDKIMAFPSGYETSVGERGLKLSGGEKQRVAIARTFLRAPQILLLDEATASLDSQTERQIQVALESISKGRTSITIAHRLSTITKSDQILVLNEGRIIERGTHAQLLLVGGYYSRMWNKQTEEEDGEVEAAK